MMHARRLRLVLGIVLGILIAGGTSYAQQASAPKAPNPYKASENWAKLPAGMQWGEVSWVDVDPRGNLWVFQRMDPQILEFDPSGKYVKSFSNGMFVQPHSLHFDRDGNLWATDGGGAEGKGNQVVKFSPDGKVLLTLGKAGAGGEGPDMFNGPTDVVTAPNGDIFISDGHRNSRIVKFSKDGKFITAWGKKGTGPGEFNGPHSIAMDSSGRLFVADRTNNRIQIFDQNGKFLAEWKQFGRPSGINIGKDDTIYVTDDQSTAANNPGFTPGVWIGNAKDGTVKAHIPVAAAQAAVPDSAGNIYTAMLPGKTVNKYVK